MNIYVYHIYFNIKEELCKTLLDRRKIITTTTTTTTKIIQAMI